MRSAETEELLLVLRFSIIILVFLFVALPLLYAFSNIYRPKMAIRIEPEGIRFDSVSISTADGQTLRGWFFRREPEAPSILVCHGVGTNREDLMEVSQFLCKAGFNVLTFDFRAHGESSGRKTTFGFLEARDVEAAVKFANHRYAGRSSSMGVYAISMGSAATIFAAQNIPEVKAFVFDSSFARLSEVVESQFRFLPSPLRECFGFLTNSYGSILMGIQVDKIAPEEAATHLHQRPVLIFHGERDTLIPISQGEKLFQRIPGPKEFVRVPGASHVQSYQVLGRIYEQKVINFFSTHLKL